MKKAHCIALVFGVCLFLSGVVDAAERIGSIGQDQYTMENLGVGRGAPVRRIHVRAETDTGKVLSVANSTSTAEIYSVSSLPHGGRFNMATSANVEVIQLNTAGISYITGSFLGIGTKTPTAQLDVVGDIKSSATITAGTDLSAAVVEIRGSGNDVAETFKVNAEHVEPGMVVSIDPKNPGELTLCREANDRKVAGIISGAGDLHTGIHLGDIPNTEAGEQAVALTGRVWCWVDTTMTGPVDPGDSLTTSTTPGHAMKVLDYNLSLGAMIGKAMTSLESGRGLVLVLVNLQ